MTFLSRSEEYENGAHSGYSEKAGDFEVRIPEVQYIVKMKRERSLKRFLKRFRSPPPTHTLSVSPHAFFIRPCHLPGHSEEQWERVCLVGKFEISFVPLERLVSVAIGGVQALLKPDQLSMVFGFIGRLLGGGGDVDGNEVLKLDFGRLIGESAEEGRRNRVKERIELIANTGALGGEPMNGRRAKHDGTDRELEGMVGMSELGSGSVDLSEYARRKYAVEETTVDDNSKKLEEERKRDMERRMLENQLGGDVLLPPPRSLQRQSSSKESSAPSSSRSHPTAPAPSPPTQPAANQTETRPPIHLCVYASQLNIALLTESPQSPQDATWIAAHDEFWRRGGMNGFEHLRVRGEKVVVDTEIEKLRFPWAASS
ncbi:hypothetical protein BT69DRAFT_1283556 [Atractiella rhizophila]|nr:hypothetical protein BT69DRAFT_1283556 [Atractiella rhizophila]